VERSDTHHLLPLSKKKPAIMRDIACPILGIDATRHKPVLDRVDMNVVDVTVEIGFRLTVNKKLPPAMKLRR
jgi:hypothetical protein